MAGKYQAYPEYKDSGIDLIGDIPECWSLSRHKYIARFQKGKNPEALLDVPNEGSVRYLSMDYLRGNADASFADIEQSSYVSKKDQVLIVWDGSNAGEFVKGQEGIVSSTMAASELISDINHGFYWYSCVCLELEMRKHANGMGIPHVNGNELKNALILLPSKIEQEQIANFLDHETAKIDTLIEKQQQLIKLLKEKRQAVISHAVTKGLNPNAPMRDSGVEWLGEVPAYWDISSLGYYAQISTGATPDRSKPIYWGGDIPWIKTGEVRYDEIFETEESITESAVDNSSVKISPPGTLLMAMYGQGITRGRVAILGVAATYNQACAAIMPNEKVWNQYLRYFFMAAYHAIRDGGNETSQMNLNADIVSKFKISIPDLDTQHQIVDYLNDKLKGFDLLLTKAESAIELIQERRTALISAAVTGKIDVRNWQAPAA